MKATHQEQLSMTSGRVSIATTERYVPPSNSSSDAIANCRISTSRSRRGQTAAARTAQQCSRIANAALTVQRIGIFQSESR
jgi:hypothetical protein